MKRTLLALCVAAFALLQFGAVEAGPDGYVPVSMQEATATYYIHDVKQQGDHLVIEAEEIAWYEGEEADEQLRLREPDAGVTETPDGYYIVPLSGEVETLTTKADPDIRMQIYNRTGDPMEADIVWNESITASLFLSLLQDEESWSIKDYPYHITFEDGKATRIVQQYIP